MGIEYASEKLRSDKEIVLAAVKNDGCALEYASEELKADAEIVLAAVKNNGIALEYASKKLKADKTIVMELNNIIRLCFETVPDELGKDLCLVTGALIIVQEPNSKWAYGYHIKKQGGGTFGEYHLILNAVEGKDWKSTVGDCIGGSLSESDLMSTAFNHEGFDVANAVKIFRELDNLWDRTLYKGESVDEEVEYPYSELLLCYKSHFSNLEDYQGSFWYVKDNISEKKDILHYLVIESVSSIVPGNMCFI